MLGYWRIASKGEPLGKKPLFDPVQKYFVHGFRQVFLGFDRPWALLFWAKYVLNPQNNSSRDREVDNQLHILTNYFKLILAITNSTMQSSGYQPLNLENGSFLNSDNFDAADLRFWSES